MKKYTNIPAQELREMLLNNTLDASLMGLDEHEKLFGYEIELDEPSSVVLDFCNKHLKQYQKYRVDFDKPPFSSIVKKYQELKAQEARELRELRRTKPTVRRVPKWCSPKRIAVALVAMMSVFLVTIGTSASEEDTTISLVRRLHTMPEKTPVRLGNWEAVRTTDIREYNSMSEMLEVEKLNILYPTKLPDGYEFNRLSVSNYGKHDILLAKVDEPYLTFTVDIEYNFPMEDYDYDYETNGIKYGITTILGNYQAYWSDDGGNYYAIVAGEKATLLEIIENLKWS